MIMRFFSAMETGTRHAKSVWYHVFHRSGVLGVESNYFHWRFFFRDLAEVVCQSVQVFSASRLVPSQWINRVFVGIVVGNCVSTPTIQYCCQRFRIQKQLRVSLRSRTRRGSIQDTHVSIPVTRRSRMFNSLVLERILCVVMDIALDMCSSMIIPVVLFQPYYPAFDLQALTFGVERLYDDVWYVTMVRVIQQVCVVSWLDLVLTWIPLYSIYASLRLVFGLVRPPLNRAIEPRARIHQSQEDEHSSTVSGRHTDVMKKASHNRPSAQAHRQRCELRGQKLTMSSGCGRLRVSSSRGD